MYLTVIIKFITGLSRAAQITISCVCNQRDKRIKRSLKYCKYRTRFVTRLTSRVVTQFPCNILCYNDVYHGSCKNYYLLLLGILLLIIIRIIIMHKHDFTYCIIKIKFESIWCTCVCMHMYVPGLLVQFFIPFNSIFVLFFYQQKYCILMIIIILCNI